MTLINDLFDQIKAKENTKFANSIKQTTTELTAVINIEDTPHSLLSFAARYNNLAATKLLIAAGADTQAGDTMWYAATYANAPLVTALIATGVPVNKLHTSKSGKVIKSKTTPLHQAINKGKHDVVKLLLLNEARTDLKAFSKKMPNTKTAVKLASDNKEEPPKINNILQCYEKFISAIENYENNKPLFALPLLITAYTHDKDFLLEMLVVLTHNAVQQQNTPDINDPADYTYIIDFTKQLLLLSENKLQPAPIFRKNLENKILIELYGYNANIATKTGKKLFNSNEEKKQFMSANFTDHKTILAKFKQKTPDPKVPSTSSPSFF